MKKPLKFTTKNAFLYENFLNLKCGWMEFWLLQQIETLFLGGRVFEFFSHFDEDFFAF